jgi:hypothetical protein
MQDEMFSVRTIPAIHPPDYASVSGLALSDSQMT